MEGSAPASIGNASGGKGADAGEYVRCMGKRCQSLRMVQARRIFGAPCTLAGVPPCRGLPLARPVQGAVVQGCGRVCVGSLGFTAHR